MYKGKNIIGKTLVAFDSGKVLNTVSNIAYNPNTGRILGLLIDETLLLAKGRHVPLSEIRTIGEDAITIINEDSIITWDENPLVREFSSKKLDLKGRDVMTDLGENLGKISDIYFLQDGTIEGYELSGGIVSDTYSGTSFLPNGRIAKIGEDIVFVPHNTVHILEEQVGGVKAATQKATEKAKPSLAATKEKAGEIAKYGMEYIDTNVMEPATRKKELFKESSGSKTKKITESADTLWEKVKDKVSDLKEQSSQQVEEKHIKGALGRPVTRVILDQTDNIILNTGELITHEAIEQARDANVLDVLLTSVYTNAPDFTKEDLKAKEDTTSSPESTIL
jgi:uncharacterized protein YrrD